MSTLTSANSTFIISIANLFATPQALQGYATDDAFSVESVEMGEVVLGVDGHVSAGFVPFLSKMTVKIQADSPSILLFDQWLGAQASARELYPATGAISIPSVGKVFTLTGGYLTGGKVMPDVKKVLGMQEYTITWGRIIAAAA